MTPKARIQLFSELDKAFKALIESIHTAAHSQGMDHIEVLPAKDFDAQYKIFGHTINVTGTCYSEGEDKTLVGLVVFELPLKKFANAVNLLAITYDWGKNFSKVVGGKSTPIYDPSLDDFSHLGTKVFSLLEAALLNVIDYETIFEEYNLITAQPGK